MNGPVQAGALLFIGLNYAPEPVGIGPFTRGLAEGLAMRGHSVRVITGRPYYPQWQAYDGYPGGWNTAQENGVIVSRCPHYIPAKPSGLKRVLHLTSFAAAALIPAIGARTARPLVVICIAPALLSVPVAWIAAKLAGAKLWIHVQDFEVEAALATGLLAPSKLRGGGPLARLARWLESGLLRLADQVSSISPQMCAKLLDKGVAKTRVIELRNWANAPSPDPAGGAAYRQQWQLGDAHVALYSGNIANKQGIEIVVEAARRLEKRRDIAFVICGEGPNRAKLEELAQSLTNISFHDLQPAERMGELLSLASVHLLPQIAGAADLVLPSKLANMLGSGRPVVATAAAGTGLSDEVQGCGLTTEPGDADAFAAAIARLIDDPAKAQALGNNGMVRAGERWSQDRIVARFDQAIANLLRGD